MTYRPYSSLIINNTDRGILIPRMTSAQREALENPLLGIMIFNYDTQGLEVYTVEGWMPVLTSGSTDIGASDILATRGITSATLADRFGHNLNVIDDFGAEGDGITDDRSALQTASTDIGV